MISLSTKGRYATRILVNLARRKDGGTASAREIAEGEGISTHYVEQLLIKLKAAGFVRSQRGKKGGFRLGVPAESITVSAVLKALEGTLSIVPCVTESCERASRCPTRPVWKKANETLARLFDSVTIAELARGKSGPGGRGALFYQI
jgi:Rrf2 family protein